MLEGFLCVLYPDVSSATLYFTGISLLPECWTHQGASIFFAFIVPENVACKNGATQK